MTVALPHRATVAIKLTHRERAKEKKKKKTLAALRWEEIRAHALWEIKIAPHFCFIIYNACDQCEWAMRFFFPFSFPFG